MKLYHTELAVLKLMEVLDQKNRIPSFTKTSILRSHKYKDAISSFFLRKPNESPKYFRRKIGHGR